MKKNKTVKQNKNRLVIIPTERVVSKIFLIRGKKIMIDRDLAELYGVETRVLNQAVRRNIDRFPSDFMFSLTRQEIMNLSQFVISSKIKHAPNVFVFTEQGVAMLSSVLNSKRAIQVNIQIIRTFTKIREFLATHKELREKIEAIERKYNQYNQKFKIVFDAIKMLSKEESKPKGQIGFRIK